MAKGGGAWKVAYADFVTAMMAFFMVMWLVNQKPEVRQAIAEHFRTAGGGKQITGNPDSSVLPPKDSGSGGRSSRAKSKEIDPTAAKMTDEGSRSNVGTLVHFPPNEVQLDDRAVAKLDAILPELQGKPHRVEIRGHAIANAIGGLQSQIDAWQISYQRSLATMQYLVDRGIDPQRIRLSQAGFSEPNLVGQAEVAVDQARVEVFLLQELFEPPANKAERYVSIEASGEAPYEEPAPGSHATH